MKFIPLLSVICVFAFSTSCMSAPEPLHADAAKLVVSPSVLDAASTCHSPELETVAAAYGASSNAELIPLYAVALNKAISRCASRVLRPLSEVQVEEVCGAYSTFVEADVGDASVVSKFYEMQHAALGEAVKAGTKNAERCIEAVKTVRAR